MSTSPGRRRVSQPARQDLAVPEPARHGVRLRGNDLGVGGATTCSWPRQRPGDLRQPRPPRPAGTGRTSRTGRGTRTAARRAGRSRPPGSDRQSQSAAPPRRPPPRRQRKPRDQGQRQPGRHRRRSSARSTSHPAAMASPSLTSAAQLPGRAAPRQPPVLPATSRVVRLPAIAPHGTPAGRGQAPRGRWCLPPPHPGSTRRQARGSTLEYPARACHARLMGQDAGRPGRTGRVTAMRVSCAARRIELEPAGGPGCCWSCWSRWRAARSWPRPRGRGGPPPPTRATCAPRTRPTCWSPWPAPASAATTPRSPGSRV